jgi:hypothetical protein
MYIIIAGLIASIVTTISNLIIMKSNINGLYDIFKISLYLIPLQFIIAFLYTYYYNKGYISGYPYPLLIIMAYGAGIIFSIIAQYYILNKGIKFTDLVGMFIILCGIFFVVLERVKS